MRNPEQRRRYLQSNGPRHLHKVFGETPFATGTNASLPLDQAITHMQASYGLEGAAHRLYHHKLPVASLPVDSPGASPP